MYFTTRLVIPVAAPIFLIELGRLSVLLLGEVLPQGQLVGFVFGVFRFESADEMGLE